MNGSVNGGGSATSYYFEWGTTTNYGNFTTTNLLSSNLTTAQPVTASIAALLPGTTYYFQLVAYNGAGYSYGGEASALTLSEPPAVTTLPASGLTTTSATLNASVDPNYSPTTVSFQWGTTTNLGTFTSAVLLTNDLTSAQPVSWTLSNLQPGTIYFYQAIAGSGGGTVDGSTLFFSTPTIPPPTLSFSPSNGYFPECVNIAVTSSVPTVYYTTDGSTPTTNSAEVAMTLMNGSYTGSILWCNPQENLSKLEVLAINGSGSNNTILLQGSSPATNLVGFPQPLFAGPGSHLYIPVVVDLQSNVTLQSLQFRVEINPGAGGPPDFGAIELTAVNPE